MRKQYSVWALLLLAAAASAQDRLEPAEDPEIPRYTVEIIIFSYEQDVSIGTELFVPDEPPPVEELDEDDAGGALVSTPEFVAPEPQTPIDDPGKKFDLTMLSEDDFTLRNIAEHLNRLDAYKPLIHFGWTQSTFPEEESEARPLSFFITPPPGLEGELKLYLSRYLHLALNLQLDAPVAATPVDSHGRDTYEYSDSQVISYPVRYRIIEDRIFKNGDLRYFDHPKFGVLAKITRAEVLQNNAYDDGETELLGEGE
jgi:hypothetical protein